MSPRTMKLAAPAARISPALAILLAAFAFPLAAQDRPIVFQHGVLSDGTTWDATATALKRELRIAPLVPNLQWWRSEADQSAQLGAFLAATPASGTGRLPLVGHSNGAIVAREFSRAGGRAEGIITLSGPHQGAPFANNWMSGAVLRDAQNTAIDIADPVQFYYLNDWQNRLNPFVFGVADAVVGFLWDIARYLCPSLGLGCVETATNATIPMVRDLATDYSGYIAGLNSNANLAAEASAMPNRIGISARFQPWNAFCYIATAIPDICVLGREGGIVLYLHAYQFYADDDDWFLSSNAYRWLNGAGALIDMDAIWQLWVGTLQYYRRIIDPELGYSRADLYSLWNDGFIPEVSAQYPNASQPHIVVPGDIAHTMMTSNVYVRNEIRDRLVGNFGIVRRTPGSTASVGVAPSASNIVVNESIQLTATAYDVDGAVVSGRTFTWSSDNAGVATVSSTGLVTGVGSGNAVISASADGYTGTATVTVTSKPVY